jgi:hypothetical protein
MKGIVMDRKINEIGHFRRTWSFECGCEAQGVSSTHQSAGWSSIQLIPCLHHTPEEELVPEFRWPSDLFDYLENIFGEPVELEYMGLF